MAVTASLDDYIKQFKQDYKKYLASETSSVSSMDTEELLSDISSETYSNDSRPLKSSIKSISSLKKRNKKKIVNPPSHMKPLHSTPLKMIQEEEEFLDSKYKLSEFLPKKQLDINSYLPQARAVKNEKVKEIIASLDMESENMSILSSVDTEALLMSSDEEEDRDNRENQVHTIKAQGKKLEAITRNVDTESLLLSSDEEKNEDTRKDQVYTLEAQAKKLEALEKTVEDQGRMIAKLLEMIEELKTEKRVNKLVL